MLKRDELGFPSFWQLQTMGWACLCVLVLVGSVPDFLRRSGAFRDDILAVVFMFMGSCVLRPICRALWRRALPWLAFEIRVFVWSLFVGAAGAFAAEFSVLGFRKMDWADLAGNSVQFAVVLFLWCSLYFSIKHWQQATLSRERLLRAEAEAREARLSALRYQLNPHFLFNSLNAVSTLVLEGNAGAATRMLAQIGELLRTSLDNEMVLEVHLSQEIAFTEQYLAIEQIRLGGRLRVDLAISPETLDALVPSMLLQPLVENAVRHGIAPVVEGGTIAIRSEFHHGQLQIIVKNSGAVTARDDKPMKGIGLSNTIERLKTLYGTDQKFTLVWPRTGGCEVRVQIPFRKSNQRQEALACAH